MRRDEELRDRFRESARAVGVALSDRHVVVAGVGGSRMRMLLPALWGTKPRLVVVGEEEIVVLRAKQGTLRAKPGPPLWQGPEEQVEAQPYLAGRMLQLTMPGGRPRRHVQISGKGNVAAVLGALGN